MNPLNGCSTAIAVLLSLVLASTAAAIPACKQEDVQELCQIVRDMRADNPEFGKPEGWSVAEINAKYERRDQRRDRARALLYEIANPTWRDLWNAGYAISNGKTPQDRLLALAASIRALSLAPNDADAHALVAITVDDIGQHHVGAQLYGRKKFYTLNATTSAAETACLPQMLDPPLPPSVGAAFDAPSRPFALCPKGVGERALDQPIAREE